MVLSLEVFAQLSLLHRHPKSEAEPRPKPGALFHQTYYGS